jgi:tetratricopeptide (TPR) repeat protein
MKKNLILLGVFYWALNGCAGQVSNDLKSGRAALLGGRPQVAEAHFQRVVEADDDYVADWSLFRVGIWTYLGRAYYDAGKLTEAREALMQALKRSENDFMARLYYGMTLLRISGPATVPEKPLALNEILYALRERVTVKRVAALIKERGVNFDFTAEAEKEIKRAGADEELIELVRMSAAKWRKIEQAQQGLQETERALREMQNWQERIAGTEHAKNWDTRKRLRSQVQTSLKMIGARRTNQPEFLRGLESIGKTIEEEINLSGRDKLN